MKKMINLKFSKKYYDLNSIMEAVSAYSKVAKISLKENRSNIIADIKPLAEIKDIEKEFANYVLGIMLNKGV